MKKLLLVTLISCVSAGAIAKGYSPSVTARAGGYDVKFAANGTPLAVPPTVQPSGQIGVSAPVSIALPGGLSYPVLASSALAIGAMLNPWVGAISAGVALGTIGAAALEAALSSAKLRIKPGGGGVEQEVAGSAYTVICQGQIYGNDRQALGLQCKTRHENYWKANGYPDCRFNPVYNTNDGSTQLNYAGMAVGCGSYPTVAPVATSNAAGGWEPITTSAAAQLMSVRAPTQAEVQALVDLNFPPELTLPQMSGPASVFKGNTVQMGLDGTIQEIEERYIASFNPGIVLIGVQTTVKTTTPEKTVSTLVTNPDGTQSTVLVTTPPSSSTTTATTNTVYTSTTTVTQPQPAASAAITCGLPGTPACKIDETGTQTAAPEVAAKSKVDIDAVESTAIAEIGKAANTAAPSWSFSFQFPTGCAPYTTGIRGFILNVCPYQDSIHGLLSAIWAASTLFAMLGMVGRTIRGE